MARAAFRAIDRHKYGYLDRLDIYRAFKYLDKTQELNSDNDNQNYLGWENPKYKTTFSLKEYINNGRITKDDFVKASIQKSGWKGGE